jgi:hypothetical protein
LLAPLIDFHQTVPASQLECVRASIRRSFLQDKNRSDAEQFDRRGFGFGRVLDAPEPAIKNDL